MDELWEVEFHAAMKDCEHPTPGLDGELIVRGTDIFDVLEKAKAQISRFGFDHITINCATRYGFERETKGEKV